MDQSFSVIQIIQLILAPAVMINACGLLLLATSNKYSSVLNRIRLLNDEKRKLSKKAGEKNFEEMQRLESLARQIEHLMARAKLVRNSVMSYTVSDRVIYRYISHDWIQFPDSGFSIGFRHYGNVLARDGCSSCGHRIFFP